MSSVSDLYQFEGPFERNQTVDLTKGKSGASCKFGITIFEKDFLAWQGQGIDTSEDIPPSPPQGFNHELFGTFRFKVNNTEQQTFLMGQTLRYETDNKIDNATITFPEGAPAGTLIDVVCYYNN